jgi:hypothetical protein
VSLPHERLGLEPERENHRRLGSGDRSDACRSGFVGTT